jgi:hypothetical protein
LQEAAPSPTAAPSPLSSRPSTPPPPPPPPPLLFDEIKDDEQLIEHVFTSIDGDGNGTITAEEASNVLNSCGDDSHLREALQRFLVRTRRTTLDRAEFKALVDEAPRVRGERVQWVNDLKLGGLLARRLKPGTLADPLHGLKNMTVTEIEDVLRLFAEDVRRCFFHKLDKLKQIGRMEPDVDAYINTKFVMDGAFEGRFATLDDFYKGPEARIGAPNPKIFKGMRNEHCFRDNAEGEFKTSNYNIRTCPRQEWEFVVDPKPGFRYPHTPAEKEQWPIVEEWRGPHGRSVIHIKEFVKNPNVDKMIKKAGLRIEEVIAVRLYTGPMFVLVQTPPAPHFICHSLCL